MSPFGPDAKCFFGPGTEGDGFNHCRCDDSVAYVLVGLIDEEQGRVELYALFTGKAAPGNRVQALLVCCLEIALAVAGKVCNLVVLVELGA